MQDENQASSVARTLRLVSAGLAVGVAATLFLPWVGFGSFSVSLYDLTFEDGYASERPYVFVALLVAAVVGVLMSCTSAGDRESEHYSALARGGFFALAAYPGVISLLAVRIFPEEYQNGDNQVGVWVSVVLATAGLAIACVGIVQARGLPLQRSGPRMGFVLTGLAWGLVVMFILLDTADTATDISDGSISPDLHAEVYGITWAAAGVLAAMTLLPLAFARGQTSEGTHGSEVMRAQGFRPQPVVRQGDPRASASTQQTPEPAPADFSRDAAAAAIPAPAIAAPVIATPIATPAITAPVGACGECGHKSPNMALQLVHGRHLCRLCAMAEQL